MTARQSGRPVFHEQIGADLRKIREQQKRWSVQQAVNAAIGKGHEALTWNKLTWLEAGKVQFPDAEVLRGVAAIYGISYSDLVSRYVASEYGLPAFGNDLLGPRGTRKSDLPSGGSDHAAAAARERIRYLEDQLIFYEELIAEARNAANQTLTILSPEGGEGGESEPRRRRRTRTTR